MLGLRWYAVLWMRDRAAGEPLASLSHLCLAASGGGGFACALALYVLLPLASLCALPYGSLWHS